MLRIKVDLVPFGDESLSYNIAEITIFNDGTGTPPLGNYQYFIKDDNLEKPIKGEIKNIKRGCGKNPVWVLVKKILNNIPEL